jgi:EpsI family protein
MVLMLAATLVAATLNERDRPDALAAPLETIPHQVAGWTEVKSAELGAGVLRELAPTSYISRSYAKDGRQLDLFVAFYAQQRAGESMHSPKHCLPGGGWEIWQHGSMAAPFNGAPAKINRYSIQNAGRRYLMLYWYQSRQRIIASEYLGKILLVRDALFDGRTAGSIVRIMVPDTPETAEEGAAFAAAIIPEIQRCFGR